MKPTTGLDGLIAALTILRKYGNPDFPTHCEHDVLTICGIDPFEVTEEDKKKLDELGFFVNGAFEAFQSYRYGSA
jgi:hypothetical protein